MKRIILVVCMFVSGHISFAQWNLNGNILENVNSGDVVISGSSHLRLYGRLVTYYPKSNSPLGGEFLGTSGWWGFRTDTDNRFHVDIYSANNPRSAFSIDQAGNVGIGNGIPSSQLHLTSNTDHAFRITRSSGMYGFRIFRNAQQGSVLFQNTDDSNNPGTRIRFEEGGSGWKNVLINPDEGNVGIGTVSPWTKLHIVGQSGDSGTGLVRLDAGSANASLRVGINTEYAWIQSHGSRPLYINDFGNNTILNTQGGNVGIGTTTPEAKLTVAGDIHSREVKVTVSAGTGPDYVFEPDYNLPTLTEIETYIKANKHLPEVPSAKEMETNGIKLSEMNMLLLKKVEELTLHLIELKKENNETKKENERQNQLILELLNKK